MTPNHYLNATVAAQLDVDLMTQPGGFCLEQLMELAGLAVAQVTYKETVGNILIVCGPGNNGGDGLVAARHLAQFGRSVQVVYPSKPKTEHYRNLIQQCKDMKIGVSEEFPSSLDNVQAIVDAMFGFSFKGIPREPYASIIASIRDWQSDSNKLIAVDIPSGWHVEEGNVNPDTSLRDPSVLISLTAPKLGVQSYTGIHYVGGRFVPPYILEEYNLQLPTFAGMDQIVRIDEEYDWGADYAAHCAAKEAELVSKEKNEEGWQEQYAAHLAEEEAKRK